MLTIKPFDLSVCITERFLLCFKRSIPERIFLRATAEKERGCADDGMILNAKQMLGRGKLSVIVGTFSRFFAHADSKRMRFLGAEESVLSIIMAPTLVRASLSAPLSLKQVDFLSLGEIIAKRGFPTTPLALKPLKFALSQLKLGLPTYRHLPTMHS